jgi:hypothetical protein
MAAILAGFRAGWNPRGRGADMPGPAVLRLGVIGRKDFYKSIDTISAGENID